jgi:hypothetical protein
VKKKKDDQPKTVEEWVSRVDEKFKQGEDWTTKRQILINTNYYLSNQWIGWDSQNRRVVTIPRRNNEERITYNIIKPRVMTKIAKQTKNRIKYDVMPDTNSQERIEIAKGATKFMHFWWNEEQMDRKTRDIFLNNAVKAFCATKTYFDPDLGDDITPSEEEAEKLGLKENKQTRTGKVVCQICDPLTLVIDPAATNDDEIRWIGEEKPKDVSYILHKYGKEVTPDENINYLAQYDVVNSGLITNNDQEKKNKNMAMVRELWINPCPEYPNGLKVTTTRHEFLDIDENAGKHPYDIFGDIPIPGSVKYEAFIKDMLPVQREINIIRTMFATHAKKMGNSIWLLPMGSNVDEDSINNDEAAIIEYNASSNGKPERVGPNDIPSFFDRILEYAGKDIDDMSGAREISQGRLPAGLDTASGLALMVEQENEKLAVSSQNYEQGMKKVLQRVLMLMKKHYTEERLGRILGSDNEVELIAFTGADLSGGEDINIVQGSSLPEMRSAQEERIMNLYKMGAIVRKDGEPDVDAFLRLMGMGDSTEIYEQHQLDENRAKMENKLYQKMIEDKQLLQTYMGYEKAKADVEIYNQTIEQESIKAQIPLEPEDFQQPPVPPKGIPLVREFQDHEIHIYQHNIFRKSNDYDELPIELQSAIDKHVAEHEQILHAPMMEQQQQQMEMQKEQAAEEKQFKQQKLQIDAMNAMSKAKVSAKAD